jgi:hypothetical protein
MPDDEKRKLTLKIDGDRLTAGNFENAVKSFFRLITDVGEDVTGQRRGIDWMVGVREGSDLVEATPEAGQDVEFSEVSQTLDTIIRGMNELREGTEERPAHFSEVALRASKSLAEVRGEGVDEVSLYTNGSESHLQSSVITTVEALLEAKYTSFGSIEGMLKSISLRRGHTFNVYRPPSEDRVECSFTDDMLDEVRGALDSRVSVWGKIKYRRDGTPVRVNVREIRKLSEGNDLPSADDVLGILNP